MKSIENRSTMVLAGVYKTGITEKPVRVIAFDNRQIFYDTWWESCNGWGYKNSLKSKVYYYRSLFDSFLKTSEFLHIEPLEDIEVRVHRPDLPFSVCRNAELSWTDKVFSTVGAYEKYLLKNGVDISPIDGLNIPSIILVPFGLKGAHKKSVMIKAANGKNFTATELLWYAHNAQAPYIGTSVEKGIGLHRLGFEKGIPSFYIGGYYDAAGFLKD
jgi:hypothetical protein